MMQSPLILLSCNGVIRTTVLYLCASLVGCSVFFDAPPTGNDIDLEASARVVDELKSLGDAAEIDINKNAKTARSKTPTLSFEREPADMPRLVVQQGLDKAIILVDGEKIGLGEMTKKGVRTGLIAPGLHDLRVECPFDPPFSAKFYLQKGDRVVLRGECSPQKIVGNASPMTVSEKKTTDTGTQQTRKAPAVVQKGKTVLLFNKSNNDTIQLSMRGIKDTAVFLNGEIIKWDVGKGTENVTIQPGHHNLRVLSKGEPPFSADFFVEKGDTVTLCGDCISSASSTRTPLVIAEERKKEAKLITQTPGRGGRKDPTLSFSKVGSGAPQLSIHAMGNSVITLNGNRIGTEGIMGVDRLLTIQAGHHILEVTQAGELPFKASFFIEAGERATLRGWSNLTVPK